MIQATKDTLLNIWNKIKNYFKSPLADIIGIGLLILATSIIFTQRKSLSSRDQQITILQNNIKAITDTLTITKTLYKKEKEYNKGIVIVKSPEDVKQYYPDLYQRIKDTRGKVRVIIQAGAVKRDTVTLVVNPDPVSVPSLPTIYNFSFDTVYNAKNYNKVKGYIDIRNNTGKMTQETGLSLTTGIKTENGKSKIFVVTDYPNMTITDIQGAEVDPSQFQSKVTKEHLLTISGHIGHPIASYNYKTRQIKLVPTEVVASVGVGINLTKLLSKK